MHYRQILLISNVVSDVGGESGGHMYAAGAIIPTELEEDFISRSEEEFRKKLED